MKFSDIISTHKSLYEGKTGHESRDSSRSFRSVVSGGLNFVTQNMHKDSANTDWINKDPSNRRITWIFKGGRYTGRVREFKNHEGQQVTQVHTLNPERLVREVVEEPDTS